MLSFSLSDALPSQRRTRPLQPAFYDLLDQEPASLAAFAPHSSCTVAA